MFSMARKRNKRVVQCNPAPLTSSSILKQPIYLNRRNWWPSLNEIPKDTPISKHVVPSSMEVVQEYYGYLTYDPDPSEFVKKKRVTFAPETVDNEIVTPPMTLTIALEHISMLLRDNESVTMALTRLASDKSVISDFDTLSHCTTRCAELGLYTIYGMRNREIEQLLT
eukprot:TRINITY_DN6135_c0_g1_i2.p1 TRINITY_DN6135_c0_g1~~TRINITY_DN6135_c0_g1_i2.p1  ORF type:complete len:168 (-),score=20.70 TRINITY_DN6135_c0_g1_i2:33-536(-)